MEEGKFERVEKRIDVWYDGVMVMGSNLLLKWELMENMVRPNSANHMLCQTMWLVLLECIKGH